MENKDKQITITKKQFAEVSADILSRITVRGASAMRSARDARIVADTIMLIMQSHAELMTELFDSEDKKEWRSKRYE